MCFNKELSYSVVKRNDDSNFYIISTDLVDLLSKTLNCTLEVLEIFDGELLKNVTYFHPIYKNLECLFVEADHVSAAKGTGLVHTAPAHGPEDFLVALNYKIPLVSSLLVLLILSFICSHILTVTVRNEN